MSLGEPVTPLAWWLVALIDTAAKMPATREVRDARLEWRLSDQRRQWLAACPRGLA